MGKEAPITNDFPRLLEGDEEGKPRRVGWSVTRGEEPTFWVSGVVLFKEQKVKK